MKVIPFLISVLLLASACSRQPDTLVGEDQYDEEEMNAAIEHARLETAEFLKALTNGTGESFSVKAPIKDSHGTEYFWLTDLTYEAGVFHGKIGNDPGIVTNVKFGQEWSLRAEEISDWMYIREAKIHGGYTIDPLLQSMPKKEAEALRSRLVR